MLETKCFLPSRTFVNTFTSSFTRIQPTLELPEFMTDMPASPKVELQTEAQTEVTDLLGFAHDLNQVAYISNVIGCLIPRLHRIHQGRF